MYLCFKENISDYRRGKTTCCEGVNTEVEVLESKVSQRFVREKEKLLKQRGKQESQQMLHRSPALQFCTIRTQTACCVAAAEPLRGLRGGHSCKLMSAGKQRADEVL